jgi:hypothetical protein
MGLTFVPLKEADRAGVRGLLVRLWERDWSEELAENYFMWRYGARGNAETLVACDRGQCVGVLDSFIRPYWIAGRLETVRETCDWFCLPEYRALGVGLHLMRQMMAKPEPILSIGGTEFTLDLLPRLKWARLRDVDNFALPLLSARTVAGLVAHRLRRRSAALVRTIPDIRLARRIPRKPPPSANVQVRVRAPGKNEELPRIAPYDLAPELETSILDWLTLAPSLLGEFVLLSFFCDCEPVGVSISRLQMLPFGRRARIVHLHPARFDVIDWMVSETVHHLIERGAGAVFCRASCPATARALSALRFAWYQSTPVYWWPTDKLLSSGLVHLTSLRGDDAFQFE